jgi:hypothetical protein
MPELILLFALANSGGLILSLKNAFDTAIKFFLITTLVSFIAAVYFVHMAVVDVSCKLGNHADCYNYNNVTQEILTPTQIAISEAPAEPLGQGYVGDRYSLLRTEWYNNHEVQTRQRCVGMASHYAYEVNEFGHNCMLRSVITGPDAGAVLPEPGDAHANITPSDRVQLDATLAEDWKHATWAAPLQPY